MTSWERVAYRDMCGGCGRLLERDAPVCVTTINGLRRKLFRCAECAGPAPPDLPSLGPRQQFTKPMQPIARAIPKDYTDRMLGERE